LFKKIRVSLARAIYADKNIVLLDDVLSAVDARVGKEIFEDCITEYLSNKIVVLVSHQLQYCPHATQILVLKDGVVEGIGKYEDLMQNNTTFQMMMSSYLSNMEKQQEEKEKDQMMKRKLHIESTQKINQLKKQQVKEEIIEKDEECIIEKEDNKIGNVGIRIWFSYLLGFGIIALIFIFIVAFGNEAFRISTDFWISYWVNNKYQNLKRGNYVLIYGMLVLGFSITLFLKYTMFSVFSFRSSKNLHNKVFARVLRATVRFFEANPTGRILNRFSKDMGKKYIFNFIIK
jgi:ABC-type multidrug transport system fused ATPase/permease subunit